MSVSANTGTINGGGWGGGGGEGGQCLIMLLQTVTIFLLYVFNDFFFLPSSTLHCTLPLILPLEPAVCVSE